MANKVLAKTNVTVEKLRALMANLSKSTNRTTALNDLMAKANEAFKEFFDTIADPSFYPTYLKSGDTARSEDYNKNFELILDDITRFYKELELLAKAQIQSFNYAQVVNAELITRASALASTVLDLKILSDFTRGDVLIAGDDFRSLDNVDLNIATASSKAEKMFGSGGLSLKRATNNSVIDSNTEVEIFPLGPSSPDKGTSVNLDPTPGNVERFYEGLYYSFINSARPEGGAFNIRFLLKPAEGDKQEVSNGNTNISDDSNLYSNANAGYFVEIGASEQEKKQARTKMFDGDPSTFWECEYVYDVPTPLINDLLDNSSVENNDHNESKGHKDNASRGVSVVIDYKAAEQAAKAFDFNGRDLVIEVMFTLKQQQTVNYCVIDPVIFGVNSFIEVLDIAIASEDDGAFITVDGWNSSKYAKILTPEANKFLNDNQIGELLAPTRYEYSGKGVFPFPSRLAKKLKVKIKMDNPIPAVYERYYILMTHQVDINTNVKTTTTKGLFR